MVPAVLECIAWISDVDEVCVMGVVVESDLNPGNDDIGYAVGDAFTGSDDVAPLVSQNAAVV